MYLGPTEGRFERWSLESPTTSPAAVPYFVVSSLIRARRRCLAGTARARLCSTSKVPSQGRWSRRAGHPEGRVGSGTGLTCVALRKKQGSGRGSPRSEGPLALAARKSNDVLHASFPLRVASYGAGERPWRPGVSLVPSNPESSCSTHQRKRREEVVVVVKS